MRSMSIDPADEAPYRQAAAVYYDCGWTEPLPLPFKRKWPPPDGFTGRHPGPSRADIQAWVDGDEGGGNVAIRLPEHIVGLDVDNYGEKNGLATVLACVDRWGELPRTWWSTAREDHGSGIRFYRVPPHMHWPGQLGADVEIIQAHHRYAVVWPSAHPEGTTYRWYDPNGLPSMVPPDPDLLPLLPQTWIDGITGGAAAGDPIAKADLTPAAALDWLKANSPPEGQCRRVSYALTQAAADLAAAGSAHEAARGAVLRLINLAADHHAGVGAAITALGQAFIGEVTRAGRSRVRDADEARGEWFGLVMGGIQIGAAKPTNPNVVDPCDNPFAGVMPVDRTRLAQPALGLLPSVTSAADYAVNQPGISQTTLVVAEESAGNQPSAELTVEALAETVEHSTWWPVDLGAVWDSDDADELPEILRRSDGACLFYRGQVNGFIGESESGKTWLAYEAIRQVLDDGGSAQLYDFEDSRRGAVNRLRALGVGRDALTRLSYINPDEPVMGAAAPQAWADLATNLAAAPDLIVVDGFNAAMGTQGLDMDSNTDVTAFIGLLRKMAAGGAAVITVDHVPKNPDGRLKGGIGAQAKRAGVTGATIRVEVDGDAYPAPGKTGTVRLSVDKDRRGGVREHAEGKHLAMVTIASNAAARTVQITLTAPMPGPVPPPALATARFEESMLETVCAAVARADKPVLLSEFRKLIVGDNNEIEAARDWLIGNGRLIPDPASPRGRYPRYVVASFYDVKAERAKRDLQAIRLPYDEDEGSDQYQ